jgi:hypothetical protein
MSLFDHPGFMAYGGGSLIFDVLHADWPVYPAGHGWALALCSLAVFPSDVRFRKVDEIDQCLLFIAVGAGPCLEPRNDFYDSKWFHVSTWREDLLELHSRGYVSGISVMTEYEVALAHYVEHKDLLVESKDGLQKLPLPIPRADDYDDDRPTVVDISDAGVRVTVAGNAALASLARPTCDLETSIRDRVSPLLAISHYDTAVREAGIVLETRLRKIVGSGAFGQALIEAYYAHLCARDGRTSAFLKVLRGELRTLFKFVRNDFAHSLREITGEQCNVLMDRISNVLETVNQIEAEESARHD